MIIDDGYYAHGFYVYDAVGDLLQKYDATYGSQTEYAYADGIDKAVLLRAGGSAALNLYAVVGDHLGSVVAILDSNGNLKESYDYTAFGKTTIRNSSGTPIAVSSLGNTLGFTGREMQIWAYGVGVVYELTGLYNYRHRYYSPELGRFLETDPIGLAGRDVNLYRYVGNGPVFWIDPAGLSIHSWLSHAVFEVSVDAFYVVGVHGSISVTTSGIAVSASYGVGMGLGVAAGIGATSQPASPETHSVDASFSGGDEWGGALDVSFPEDPQTGYGMPDLAAMVGYGYGTGASITYGYTPGTLTWSDLWSLISGSASSPTGSGSSCP